MRTRKHYIVPGMYFGDWEIVKEVEPIRGTYNCSYRKTPFTTRRFECLCLCGTRRIVRISNLLTGSSTGCGCFRTEKMRAGYQDWVNRHTPKELFRLRSEAVRRGVVTKRNNRIKAAKIKEIFSK